MADVNNENKPSGLMSTMVAMVHADDEASAPDKTPQDPQCEQPNKDQSNNCSVCNKGGDLLSCDRCPASLHPECCNPPLDVEDIPTEPWLCEACKQTDSANEEKSLITPPAIKKKKTRKHRSGSSKKGKKARDDKARREAAKLEEAKREEAAYLDIIETVSIGDDEPKPVIEEDLTPIELLMKAANAVDPKQFDLPQQMKAPIALTENKNGKRNSGPTTEDLWGKNIPLPAKECYVCHFNSKRGPLIQCDYCPLLYHQDCLTPPLSNLPMGRWMCPNHVSNHIDMKVLNSIAVTERAAIWDRFSAPVDPPAFKVDFLRCPRRNSPRFRVKMMAPPPGRVMVPPMVRFHYKKPAPLLPTRRQFVRCSKVQKKYKPPTVYKSKKKAYMKRKLKRKIGEASRMEGTRPCEVIRLESCTSFEADHDYRIIIEPTKNQSRRSTDKPAEPQTSEHSDSDFEQQIHATVKKCKAMTLDNPRAETARRQLNLMLHEGEDVDELLSAAEETLKKFDKNFVKLLAWQRLRQMTPGEQIAGATPWANCVLDSKGPLRANLRRPILQPQLSGLLDQVDRERVSETVWGKPSSPSPPPLPRPVPVNAPIIASLVPIVTQLGSNVEKVEKPLRMRSNSIEVGSESTCDVVLDGKCRRVSPLHAIIFYDEVTNNFELLNYSEWGSLVNGVRFACDLNPPSTESPESPEAAADARASLLRDIVSKRIPRQLRTKGPLTAIDGDPCSCPKRLPSAAGAYEGSAIVGHGALLQFGCYSFVFSITNAKTNTKNRAK